MAVWKAEAMEVSALSITDRLGVASAFFLLLATDLILLLGLGCGCEEGDIRLADNSGFSKSSGRVEFCHAGEWGTVCLDGWNSKGTKVVCKQLGLPTNDSTHAPFGGGNGTTLLEKVKCSGLEERLESCNYNGPHMFYTCVHALGVICGDTRQSEGRRCGYEESESNLRRDEIERFGNCVPFKVREYGTPCDVLYTPGVDYVYIPYRRGGGTLDDYLDNLNFFGLSTAKTSDQCLELLRKSLCHFYLPPCGNSSIFIPPTSICTEECNFVAETCPFEWEQLMTIIGEYKEAAARYAITPLNCSTTGEYLDPGPYCCSDIGIRIPCSEINGSGDVVLDSVCLGSASTSAVQPSLMVYPDTSHQNPKTLAITVGSVCAAVAVLLLVVICSVVWILMKKHWKRKQSISESFSTVSELTQGGEVYANNHVQRNSLQPASEGTPNCISTSSYFCQMAQLLIPGQHIHLRNCVGQGKFGIVYKAILSCWKGDEQELVAVKTLKGTFSIADLKSMVEESLKMSKFNHPNVMRLVGVCIDGGESPYIVMPFMIHGSLLSYLRKHRAELTIANDDNMELVTTVQKKLLSMCLQIAKGMLYLANEAIVHRDLAARNCMIGNNFVIKVSDFGLSEDVYNRKYFKQSKLGEEGGDQVKLPVKWMAVESLNDGVFSEKTDVWSFGVTCWEVFSLGKSPYPGVDPFALIKYLERGERLEKPVDAACSQEIYCIMKECWKELPDKRPSFSELVTTISTSLEAIAGYLDFTATPLTPAGEDASGRSRLTVTIIDEDGDSQEKDCNLD